MFIPINGTMKKKFNAMWGILKANLNMKIMKTENKQNEDLGRMLNKTAYSIKFWICLWKQQTILNL